MTGGTCPPYAGGNCNAHPTTTTVVSIPSTHSGGLPFTGSDVAPVAGLGVALAACGAVLVRRFRARRLAGG
jgi:hypothetical protein